MSDNIKNFPPAVKNFETRPIAIIADFAVRKFNGSSKSGTATAKLIRVVFHQIQAQTAGSRFKRPLFSTFKIDVILKVCLNAAFHDIPALTGDIVKNVTIE